MKIAFFASSLVSAYWYGAATYYRGIVRALASRGHRITFFEPDAYERQKHRDIPDPSWATVVVYPPTAERDYPFEETAVFERPGHPAMYFVEDRYAGDWTNWWIPNRACVEAMLRSAGFAIETRAEDEVYLCRRQPRRAVESDAEVAPRSKR
jgi:hypothetical protein